MGGFKDAEFAHFSLHAWLEGSYQSQKEKYLNDQTGFRPDIVRLNNQVDYTVFDKTHAGWTVKGKNQYLFQYPYIEAYYGDDFVGYPTIRERTIKLKAIQDTLHKLGKTLILVYAPSKASSFPEYFPDNYLQPRKRMTNYDAYRGMADSVGINQVDMDNWFIAMNGKSKEPLFSKQGTHFTTYGAILAGDSLVRYMEDKTGIRMQHPDWSEMEHTDKLRSGDDDVALELNLIFPITKEILAYPVIKDVHNPAERKINAVYIGDSYGHKMVEFGIVHYLNAQCEYWFMFNGVHDLNSGPGFTFAPKYCDLKDYDWQHSIDKTDCVVLVYTSFNLKDMGNGFVEQEYDHYYPKAGKNITQ